jgi:UDP-sugar pyrophosphorylase
MSLDTLDLTSEESKIVQLLLDNGQKHLFEKWPAKGTQDDDKRRLLAQAAELDKTVPGGIKGYCDRARALLEDSRSGANPYEGYKPMVPVGQRLETQTEQGRAEFEQMENLGVSQLAKTAFTMVAGGLGERLGYNGIKIALPSEITTETTYLELYIKNILAFQTLARQGGDASLLLPLAIMTSGDTDGKTRALLDSNDYFGMSRSQLTIIKQELVPALLDNSARFALSEPFEIDVKPHGHGDVHTLLFQSGLVSKWTSEGRKWLMFFQDTNGLVFRALPAAIGVSVSKNLAVNSLAVPRKPGEAVGAICKLEGEKKSITINVEYNQLDALFKASKLTDEVDQKTGFSSYPGNTNVLIFSLPEFNEELQRSRGVISEFVNPKYADVEKTTFQKPTRLECMMQDYPKLLAPDVPVGFSEFERWTSFSAVKNNIKDAVGKQTSTGAAESAASGEFDIYRANRILLAAAGVEVTVDGKEEVYANIKVIGGARVVLAPSFGVSRADIKQRIRGKVRISDRSTLVLEGDITIKNLDLDGTLVVRVAPGASLAIEDVTVQNKGWQFVPLSAQPYCTELRCCNKFPCSEHPLDEKYLIRGYTLSKAEQAVVEVASGAKSLSIQIWGSSTSSL